ncbi:hypothetical protein GALMADRAFT_152735 [Galerina marginata CBS 339.88]|uniref:F-box domain-containing protein n=1 Tax=Galerina marginata (strain CBS 339.88) TaxID=685588 RepID=A0A067TPW9_GALM3|nr:hypothetical protein GALMADRAFT_152735 [Galerina marginata CBS 339.88]
MRCLPLKVLHFSHMEIMPLSWWEAFVHTAPHLTFLDISVCPRRTAEDALDIMCIQVPRILASVPLTYISLTPKGHAFLVCDAASPESHSLEADEAIALSYATNICTLKYIDIYKEIEIFTGATTWWKVVRSSSSGDEVGVQVKTLEECDGTAMKRWYDLEA